MGGFMVLTGLSLWQCHTQAQSKGGTRKDAFVFPSLASIGSQQLWYLLTIKPTLRNLVGIKMT